MCSCCSVPFPDPGTCAVLQLSLCPESDLWVACLPDQSPGGQRGLVMCCYPLCTGEDVDTRRSTGTYPGSHGCWKADLGLKPGSPCLGGRACWRSTPGAGGAGGGGAGQGSAGLQGGWPLWIFPAQDSWVRIILTMVPVSPSQRAFPALTAWTLHPPFIVSTSLNHNLNFYQLLFGLSPHLHQRHCRGGFPVPRKVQEPSQCSLNK